MRILTVASEVPPVQSGVARAVGRVVDGLAARGHEVSLLSADDAPALRRDELRLSGLGFRLRHLLARFAAADVVNVHGPSPTIADAVQLVWSLTPRRRRPPLVYTHHFTVWLEHPRMAGACRLYDGASRRLAQHVSRLVVTTSEYAALVATPSSPPIDVIPWGVDAERFALDRTPYDGRRPLRVLLLGQLRRYKGGLVAIDAVAGQPELTLTLAGRGPLEPVLRDAVGRHPNMVLRTDVSDDELPRLFADHDVVLLPSTNRLEAFGIALLEGMAAGCVPVASDLPGVAEVAGATGLVARTGDSADLRAQLRFLAANPAEVHRRSCASRHHAHTFSWDRTVAGYEQTLAAAIEQA